MLTINKPRVMWAWVCQATGMVFDEGWGNTEDYARAKTEKAWGKNRTKSGVMRLVCVTIEPLTDVEANLHRAEYEAWRNAKDAKAQAA